MVLAVIALIAALAGTGYAASKFSGKELKKRSEPGNRFKKNTITGTEVKESKLGQVPKAGDAQTLQNSPPSAFVSTGQVKRFSITLGYGQSQQLFTAGPFTFTARCVQNQTDVFTNPNRDFGEILISTSQDGAVFVGALAKQGGAGATSFLNTNTPEAERAFIETDSTATGTRNYDAEDTTAGAAEAPDGTAVSVEADGTAGAENEFGAACLMTGVAVVDSG